MCSDKDITFTRKGSGERGNGRVSVTGKLRTNKLALVLAHGAMLCSSWPWKRLPPFSTA